MTFGTIVRIISGVGVVAGLLVAADHPENLALSLRVAGFSFLVFWTAVLMKIERK